MEDVRRKTEDVLKLFLLYHPLEERCKNQDARIKIKKVKLKVAWNGKMCQSILTLSPLVKMIERLII